VIESPETAARTGLADVSSDQTSQAQGSTGQ
jgi:hypothetical protein